MQVDDKGMALVSVIITLTVLLTLANILFEKIWYSARQSTMASSREQVFWAAQSGIEAARQRLTLTYATSSGWSDYLTTTSGTTYPSTPSWTMSFSGIAVDIYVRDNPDGDGNFQIDNDLKIFVLAHAAKPSGVEAVIEAFCEFSAPAAHGGNTPDENVNQHLDLAASQITDYEITD